MADARFNLSTGMRSSKPFSHRVRKTPPRKRKPTTHIKTVLSRSKGPYPFSGLPERQQREIHEFYIGTFDPWVISRLRFLFKEYEWYISEGGDVPLVENPVPLDIKQGEIEEDSSAQAEFWESLINDDAIDEEVPEETPATAFEQIINPCISPFSECIPRDLDIPHLRRWLKFIRSHIDSPWYELMTAYMHLNMKSWHGRLESYKNRGMRPGSIVYAHILRPNCGFNTCEKVSDILNPHREWNAYTQLSDLLTECVECGEFPAIYMMASEVLGYPFLRRHVELHKNRNDQRDNMREKLLGFSRRRPLGQTEDGPKDEEQVEEVGDIVVNASKEDDLH